MNPKLGIMTEGAMENMTHWAELTASPANGVVTRNGIDDEKI